MPEPRRVRPIPSAAPLVMASTDGTDRLTALLQMTLALRPPSVPLVVCRALLEAAELEGWNTGHRSYPGFELEPSEDGVAVWWKVVDL